MHIVEIKRVRRVLYGFAVALFAIVVIAVGINSGYARVDYGTFPDVTMTQLLGSATLGAFFAATCIAPGLASEASTTAIAWSRPIARNSVAWRYIVVDLLAIAFVLTMVLLAMLVIVTLQGELPHLRVDATAPVTLFRGLGAAFMWYGLIVVLTSRFPARASMVAGVSWPVFTLIAAFATLPFPPLAHSALVAANYLNPMALFGVVDPLFISWGAKEVIGLTVVQRTIVEWLIAAVAIVAAVPLWSTREA